ncbi:MAG: RecB family exonuclease [Armatimonadetes bacterium OLB18]|nr:MAG: RecB family exonuclease [Armatimonadetes bacterium OLB18]
MRYTLSVARKPSLSPSKITLFLACKLKYRWTYFDPRGRAFFRAKSYYSFGTTLHRVLQRFHDPADTDVVSVEQAVQAVHLAWVSAGYTGPEQEQAKRELGEQAIRDYVEAHLAAPSEAVTIALERFLQTDMGSFRLLGRVDRIDEWPDGSIEIIDYKSGRSNVEEDEVRGDLAMNCYHLLVREAFPERPILATIVAVRTGNRATVGFAPEEADRFGQNLRVLGEEILGTDWEEVVPVRIPACETCDFVPLCARHPEFDISGLTLSRRMSNRDG